MTSPANKTNPAKHTSSDFEFPHSLLIKVVPLLPIPIVEQALPELLRSELTSNVETLLPAALHQLFPNLSALAADDTLAPNDPGSSKTSEPFKLKAVETAILPHLLARIQDHPRIEYIKRYIDDAYEHEKNQRTTADLEFREIVEGYTREMDALSE